MLRDGLITRDDIYNIVYNTMKSLAYLDKNELNSLQSWQEKIIGAGGYCLFERHNEMDDIGFMFAF